MLKPVLNPFAPNNSKTENQPAKATTKNNIKNAYKYGQTRKNAFTTKQSKKRKLISRTNNKTEHLKYKIKYHKTQYAQNAPSRTNAITTMNTDETRATTASLVS
jgi:hypothetical protein